MSAGVCHNLVRRRPRRVLRRETPTSISRSGRLESIVFVERRLLLLLVEAVMKQGARIDSRDAADIESLDLRHDERGAVGYILLWLMGVPASLLFVVFLLRGCN